MEPTRPAELDTYITDEVSFSTAAALTWLSLGIAAVFGLGAWALVYFVMGDQIPLNTDLDDYNLVLSILFGLVTFVAVLALLALINLIAALAVYNRQVAEKLSAMHARLIDPPDLSNYALRADLEQFVTTRELKTHGHHVDDTTHETDRFIPPPDPPPVTVVATSRWS